MRSLTIKNKSSFTRGSMNLEIYTKADFRFLLLKYSFIQELKGFFDSIPEGTEVTEYTFSDVDYTDEDNVPAAFSTNGYMMAFYLLYKGDFKEGIEAFTQYSKKQLGA